MARPLPPRACLNVVELSTAYLQPATFNMQLDNLRRLRKLPRITA
jgi:hypothetical protein